MRILYRSGAKSLFGARLRLSRSDFSVVSAELFILRGCSMSQNKVVHRGGQRMFNRKVSVLLKECAPSACKNS